MVTYNDILKANLTPLNEAVQKWKILPGKIRQVGTNFKDQVETPLKNADWQGHSGEAAQKKANSVSQQIEQWACEAEDIHLLLSDAYAKFKSARDTVKKYKKLAEDDKNLLIDKEGNVSYSLNKSDADEYTGEEKAAHAKQYVEAVQSYNKSIRTAVGDATTADEALAWILSQDVNGRDRGFTENAYLSIQQGVWGKEDALKDLATVTELAQSGDRLSPEQIKEANALLARHEGDPFFAEKFATKLKARGTLEFWEAVTDDTTPGNEERVRYLKRLQKSLGFTLATASHSDSDAMIQWKRDIVELGPERVSKEGSFGKPYGFHLMSSLLKYGEYDKDFLVDYGKGIKDPDSKDGRADGLLEFDRKHKRNLKDFWESDWEKPYLDFDKDADQGVDPMGGYMQALGNNPEAAQAVFHQDGFQSSGVSAEPNADLTYLLKDRDWPDENGRDKLGHALEAASLGHPYGHPEMGLHRDGASANVASQVISIVGDPENTGRILDDKSTLNKSVAKIGAGYIDDLDYGLNFGETEYNKPLRARAFHHEGSGHIDLSNELTLGFLREAGSTEDGYKVLSAAQHQYTTSALVAHGEPNSQLSEIIQTGAGVQGALNEAYAHTIQEGINDKKEEEGRNIEEDGEWNKAAISQTLAVTAGAASTPFAGPQTGAAVAFAVPTLMETTAGIVETFTGLSIDEDVEKKIKEMEDEIDAKSVKTRADFNSTSEIRAANPLDIYDRLHPEFSGDPWYESTKRKLEFSYRSGVQAIQSRNPG